MFHTSLYNKDGERQTAFLLITSACVYILTNQTSTKKPWKTEAVIRLEELDYIAVSSPVLARVLACWFTNFTYSHQCSDL